MSKPSFPSLPAFLPLLPDMLTVIKVTTTKGGATCFSVPQLVFLASPRKKKHKLRAEQIWKACVVHVYTQAHVHTDSVSPRTTQRAGLFKCDGSRTGRSIRQQKAPRLNQTLI